MSVRSPKFLTFSYGYYFIMLYLMAQFIMYSESVRK